MKAAYRERYGRPQDVLEVREVDVPVPVEDQVLARVTAASVNRADLDALMAKPWITRFGRFGFVAARSRESSVFHRTRS